MLREYNLIPRLFYYASNESIFNCNTNLFLTLCCLYIYWSYRMLLDQMWRHLFNKTLDFMCSSECEESYYSFPSQELWRYSKEKGKNIRLFQFVIYVFVFTLRSSLHYYYQWLGENWDRIQRGYLSLISQGVEIVWCLGCTGLPWCMIFWLEGMKKLFPFTLSNLGRG